MTSTKFKIVFILGGPGSGKGTQSALISKKFGYIHLSAGDLLRAERQKSGEVSEMIETCIREGKIVPAEVTVGLIRTAMNESGYDKFLIDGFPRNPDNLSCWEKLMNKDVEVQFLLFLDVPEDIMTERLLERGKTSGRSDDNLESIKKRFKTYINDTKPIIDKFNDIGKVRKVDSTKSIEDVFTEVATHFSNLK